MSKIAALASILNGFTMAKLNSNFAAIVSAFQNTLSRDGSGPNAMGATLDMNSFKIINLQTPTNSTDATNKAYVDMLAGGHTSSFGDMFKSDNLAGLTNVPTALSNLGLGTLATLNNVSTKIAAGTNITTTTIGDVTTINSSSGGGDMIKTDNLSGLSNYTTARSNMGLGSLAVLSDVSTKLAAGTNVTITGPVAGVMTINASLAGGTVSSVAGSSVNGELVLFNGTSGASLKNSSCVPTANGLSLISAANYAAMLTLLGVTSAGTTALGTSGATIPLLSTSNTWTLTQAFTVAPTFGDQSGTRTNLGLGTAATQPSTVFEPAGAYSAQNNQSGTTYTLVLTDQGKLVTMNNASANTLTIPLNASVAFPVLARIDLASLGAGLTTIAVTGGVTLNSSGAKTKLTGQWSGASLVKTATDTWLLVGDIA